MLFPTTAINVYPFSVIICTTYPYSIDKCCSAFGNSYQPMADNRRIQRRLKMVGRTPMWRLCKIESSQSPPPFPAVRAPSLTPVRRTSWAYAAASESRQRANRARQRLRIFSNGRFTFSLSFSLNQFFFALVSPSSFRVLVPLSLPLLPLLPPLCVRASFQRSPTVSRNAAVPTQLYRLAILRQSKEIVPMAPFTAR
jgi:hypothetical protein